MSTAESLAFDADLEQAADAADRAPRCTCSYCRERWGRR